MNGLAYDSLHDALLALQSAQEEYANDVRRFVESTTERFATEERIAAELRDDLHALANRIEALTNAR